MVSLFLLKFHTPEAAWVGAGELLAVTLMCNISLVSIAKATFDAISKTYSYLTPDLWKETVFTKSPYQVRRAQNFCGPGPGMCCPD